MYRLAIDFCIEKNKVISIRLQLNNNQQIVLEIELILVIILIDFHLPIVFTSNQKKHFNITSKTIKENWIEKEKPIFNAIFYSDISFFSFSQHTKC